jgi:hypothetical protein
MAWEWSHTDEAYADARQHVERLPRRELLTILREWAYEDRGDRTARMSIRGAFRLPAGVRTLPTDVLADMAWARAEAHRTCTNGGWDAYVCPYGCHTVPFDPPDEE